MKVTSSSLVPPTNIFNSMNRKLTIEELRHTCSHVLAQAVQGLWPDVKLAIGPAIENGFYYDFDKKEPFLNEDLEKIEQCMQRIIDENLPLRQIFLPRNEAIALFKKMKEDYKVELIENLPDENISIYKTGEKFVDLCKGPHADSTGQIKAFKLLSLAGAYWHGDENNAMLQRIYGTCFESREELTQHLQNLEETQKRDHRKLGTQLDLFNIYHESAGAGLVFYHPAGAMLRKNIEDYVRAQHMKRGYDFVMTPNILKGKLWEMSGHAGYYRENMYYFTVDQEEYAVKPMNCPGHMLIYKSKTRSYRDLPIRFFELGTVYRQEKAGVLHGLLRVRGFTQDDAHIFCRQDQLQTEVMGVIDFVFSTMKDFGFTEYEVGLSTRPEKFIGTVENWDCATEALRKSLEDKNVPFHINEGDGAFYGPKIDIELKDALGRSWQCATIQCDFALPERFDLSYVNEQGENQRPIMIHRAILGSVERFIGTLIEHYGGAFPLWLAPVQAMVIPIKDSHQPYAEKVKENLQGKGLRVIIDARNESLNKRIREGTMQKIPYLLVVGDREASSEQVSVRKRSAGDLGSKSLDDLYSHMQREIDLKE